MSVELELKEYILSKYRSIRAFTQAVEIPYSTIDTMIKKGIGGTGVNTVIKICKALSIDVEKLSEGYISEKKHSIDYNPKQIKLIKNYNSLNKQGQEKLLEYSEDLINSGNYFGDNTEKQKHA